MKPHASSRQELEVKAPVADPSLLRRHLLESGAESAYRGMLEDRVLDRDGELKERDEVLRVRTWRPEGAPPRAQMAWKGPTQRTPEGYKVREELEFAVERDGGPALQLLSALGYRVTKAIDRYVEVYHLRGAEARLEWYPHMDVLVEVEGSAEAIEAVLTVSGLPRGAFEPEPLAEFVRRFEARTGEAAAIALADLKGGRPSWERR